MFTSPIPFYEEYVTHQSEIIKALQENKHFLHLNHFLPEYFNTYEGWTNSSSVNIEKLNRVQDLVSKSNKSTSVKGNDSQKDFALNELMKENNILSTKNFKEIKELVQRKFEKTEKCVENMVFIALTYYFLYILSYQGYEIIYLNQAEENILNLSASILSIKLNEGISFPSIIENVLFHELLLIRQSTDLKLSQANIKELNYVKQFISHFIIKDPYFFENQEKEITQKLIIKEKLDEEKGYIHFILSGLLNLQKFEGVPQNYQDLISTNEQIVEGKKILKQLLNYFYLSVIEQCLRGEYQNIFYLTCFKIVPLYQKQLVQILINVFELQTYSQSLESINVQQFLSSTMCYIDIKLLYEHMSSNASDIQCHNIIQYIHHLYFELCNIKECPYGSFLVYIMILDCDDIDWKQKLSAELATKLFQILKKYLNDIDSEFSVHSNTIKILRMLGQNLKRFNLNQEYEELVALFIKWSFYSREGISFSDLPFQEIDKFPEYYKQHLSKQLNLISLSAKNLLLEQINQYPINQYQITRSLLLLERQRSEIQSLAFLEFVGDYIENFYFSSHTPTKLKKETLQQIFRISIDQISGTFTFFKQVNIESFIIRNMSNNEIKYFDKMGNVMKDENILTIFIELFIEFLKENKLLLANSIKESSQLIQSNTSIWDHQNELIKSNKYEQSVILNKYVFFILISFKLAQAYDKSTKNPSICLNLKQLVCELISAIISLYDQYSIHSVIAEHNYSFLKKCTIAKSQLFMKEEGFNNILKLYPNQRYEMYKYPSFIYAEDLPFFLLILLVKLNKQNDDYPTRVNLFATQLFKSSIESKEASSLENLLKEANVRLFGEKNSTTFSMKQFLIGNNRISKVFQFFQEFQIEKQGSKISLIIMAKNHSSNSEKQRQKLQQMNFFFNSIDTMLSDIIVFQEYCKLISKQQIGIKFLENLEPENDDYFHLVVYEIIENMFIEEMIFNIFNLTRSCHQSYIKPRFLKELTTKFFLNLFEQQAYCEQSSTEFFNYLKYFQEACQQFRNQKLNPSLLIIELKQIGEICIEIIKGILLNNKINISYGAKIIASILEQLYLSDLEVRAVIHQSKIQEKEYLQNQNQDPSENAVKYQHKSEEVTQKRIRKVQKQEKEEDINKIKDQEVNKQLVLIEEFLKKGKGEIKREFGILTLQAIGKFYSFILKQQKDQELLKGPLCFLNKIQRIKLQNKSPIETLILDQVLSCCFNTEFNIQTEDLKQILLKLNDLIKNIIKSEQLFKEVNEIQLYGRSVNSKIIDNIPIYLTYQDFSQEIPSSILRVKKLKRIDSFSSVMSQLNGILKFIVLNEQEIQQLYDQLIEGMQVMMQFHLEISNIQVRFLGDDTFESDLSNSIDLCLEGIKNLINLVQIKRLSELQQIVNQILDLSTVHSPDQNQLQALLPIVNAIFIGNGEKEFKQLLKQKIIHDILITKDFKIPLKQSKPQSEDEQNDCLEETQDYFHYYKSIKQQLSKYKNNDKNKMNNQDIIQICLKDETQKQEKEKKKGEEEEEKEEEIPIDKQNFHQKVENEENILNTIKGEEEIQEDINIQIESIEIKEVNEIHLSHENSELNNSSSNSSQLSENDDDNEDNFQDSPSKSCDFSEGNEESDDEDINYQAQNEENLSEKQVKCKDQNKQAEIKYSLEQFSEIKVTSDHIKEFIIKKFSYLCLSSSTILYQVISELLVEIDDKQNQDNCSKLTQSDEKINASSDSTFFEFRNPTVAYSIYEQNKFSIQMSAKQEELISLLAHKFMTKTDFLIKQSKKVKEQQKQYPFFEASLLKELSQFVSLKSMRVLFLNLINNFSELILPVIEKLSLKGVNQELNQFLVNLKGSEDEVRLIDYLVQIPGVVDIAPKQVVHEIMKLYSVNNKQIMITRFFFTYLEIISAKIFEKQLNLDEIVVYQGLIQFLINLLESLMKLDRQSLNNLFFKIELIINKATTLDNIILIKQLGIFQLYKQTLSLYFQNIYGTSLNYSDQISGISNHFYSFFEKDKIKDNLEIGIINKEVFTQEEIVENNNNKGQEFQDISLNEQSAQFESFFKILEGENISNDFEFLFTSILEQSTENIDDSLDDIYCINESEVENYILRLKKSNEYDKQGVQFLSLIENFLQNEYSSNSKDNLNIPQKNEMFISQVLLQIQLRISQNFNEQKNNQTQQLNYELNFPTIEDSLVNLKHEIEINKNIIGGSINQCLIPVADTIALIDTEQISPELYNFEADALEKYGIDNEIFQSLGSSSRIELLEDKKKQFEKQQKILRMKVHDMREQIEIDKLFRNDTSIEESKKKLKGYLKSKEFKDLLKKQEKSENRILLLSQESEYVDMFEGKIKKKAKKLFQMQEITQKKDSNLNKKLKGIKDNSLNLFKCTKKAIKRGIKKKQAKQQKISLNEAQKCLSFPLISQDTALKSLVVLLLFKKTDDEKEIWNLSFLNPFNYIKLLGLVMLIASKLNFNQAIGIPYLDSLLLNLNLYQKEAEDERELEDEGNKTQIKPENCRVMLLNKCNQIIALFLKSSLGIRLLQLEEISLLKDIKSLEYLEDKSEGVWPQSKELFESNMFDEKELDLEIISFKNISFKNAAFQIVLESNNELFSSFEEYAFNIIKSAKIPAKLGQFRDDEKYGMKQYDSQKFNFQEQEMIDSALALLNLTYKSIIQTKIKVGQLPKHQYFIDQNTQLDSSQLSILSQTSRMVIKTISSHQSKLKSEILKFVISYFVFYNKNLSDSLEIEDLLKSEFSSFSCFSDLSKMVFMNYESIFTEVFNDISQPLKNYQVILKKEFGRDIINRSEDNEDDALQSYHFRDPIIFIQSNISQLFFYFLNSLKKNIKFFLKKVELILPHRMVNYYSEYRNQVFFEFMIRFSIKLLINATLLIQLQPIFIEQIAQVGKHQAKIWWKEKEKLERQIMNNQIRDTWLSDESPFMKIYNDYFDYCILCFQLQYSTFKNVPYHYFDFLNGFQSFVKLYEKLVIQTSEAEISKDDVEMPALGKIISQNEEQNNEVEDQKRKNIQTLVLKEEIKKNKRDALYNSLVIQFIPLFNSQSKGIWKRVISSLDFTKQPLENKIVYLVVGSDIENHSRKNPSYGGDMTFVVDRENAWYSFFTFFSQVSPHSLIINDIDLSFKDEDGIDAGGLTRDFYIQIFKDFTNPNKGFFTPSTNGITMQPSPFSSMIPDHLLHFKYAGRILAKSILKNYNCEVDFTRSFLKQILGMDLFIQDLEGIDPELTKNLIWILDNDISGINLTFAYETTVLGKQHTIELVPNGSEIEVNEQNKKEYVKLLAYSKMIKSIEPQIKAFQEGFYDIIPLKIIKVLTLREFGFKISGEHTIDLEDLRKNMKLSGYTFESQQIIWLFEILEKYSQEQRAGFLFFVTGSFRVPYGGFSNFKIQISKLTDTISLPKGHTCSSEMELPEYETKEIMERKLELAFVEGSRGFYIK